MIASQGAFLPLTPSAFLEAAAAQLDRLHGADMAAIRLRGIPMKTSGTSRAYSGFVYAAIRDPRTNDALDARIPVQIAGTLEWGREAVFVGLVRYKVRRGQVHPEFRVDAVGEAGPTRLLARDELLARWSEAAARAKRDGRAALRGDRPRVVVITGVGSVAMDDIRSQMREAEAELQLEVVRVAMSRPEEVASAVRQAADAHAIVLTRGGGPDVHDLDTDVLIGAVASSPVPVLVALGHAPDDLVLGRVADACFPTPTALGAWLRETVEGKRLRERELEEARLLTASRALLGRLEAVEGTAWRWRWVAMALAAAWVATVVWLTLRP